MVEIRARRRRRHVGIDIKPHGRQFSKPTLQESALQEHIDSVLPHQAREQVSFDVVAAAKNGVTIPHSKYIATGESLSLRVGEPRMVVAHCQY